MLCCGLLPWYAGKSSADLPAALHRIIPVAAGNITFLPQIQNLFKKGNNLKKEQRTQLVCNCPSEVPMGTETQWHRMT